MPRAPLPVTSVTPDRMASSTTSKGVTPSSSLLRAHAPNQFPTSWSALISRGPCRLLRALCWEPILPDVISANLSSDAWPSTPTVPPSALACFFLGVIGLPSLLVSQIAPNAAAFAGWPSLLRPGRTCFVASARTGYAIRPVQAIDRERTFTFPDLRLCRPLRRDRAEARARCHNKQCHVSSGPPAIPEGRISQFRFSPWLSPRGLPRMVKLKRSLAYTPTHTGLPSSSSLKAWLL
jgi:hypothetical protein